MQEVFSAIELVAREYIDSNQPREFGGKKGGGELGPAVGKQKRPWGRRKVGAAASCPK